MMRRSNSVFEIYFLMEWRFQRLAGDRFDYAAESLNRELFSTIHCLLRAAGSM